MPLQVMADLEQHRIPLNSHIVSSFLDACKHPPLTAEQCEKVFAVAAAFRATCQPDNWVYTALLNFCAEKAPEQALDVWHALEEVWAQLVAQILGCVLLRFGDALAGVGCTCGQELGTAGASSFGICIGTAGTCRTRITPGLAAAATISSSVNPWRAGQDPRDWI